MKQFIICPNCGSIELHEISYSNYLYGNPKCQTYNDFIDSNKPIMFAKAISIKQPWAYLIASGIKDIENRTWPTKYRGPVLLHAGAKEAGTYSSLLTNGQLLALPRHTLMCLKHSVGSIKTTSAIIGIASIVDCVKDYPSIWAEKDCYNWVMDKPILFEKPILNVKGKLSFFIPELS